MDDSLKESVRALPVGLIVGPAVGAKEGWLLGICDGTSDGMEVGRRDG